MKRLGPVATLLGAASLVVLAGCRTAPEPARVTLHVGTSMPVQAEARLFVMANFAANFGTNAAAFRDSFLALAHSCGVAVDYFTMPALSDQLTLDPDPNLVAARAELQRRLTAFKPDGILEIDSAGWHGSGGLSANPSAPLSYGTFDLKFRLLDGKTRAEQWHASGSLIVKAGAGGDLLAPDLLHLLTTAGALPHCPK